MITTRADCYLCRKAFQNGESLQATKLGLRHKRCPGLPKPIAEKHIEETCTAWLELDGWRTINTDPKHLRGLGVSEPGMADKLYIRYLHGFRLEYPTSCGTRVTAVLKAPAAETIWIEWKRKGGKAGEHQALWIAAERARGALVWLAGDTFPAVIEEFQAFYRASGLPRRSGL